MQPTLTADIQGLENDLEGIGTEENTRISRVNRIDKGRLLDFNNYSMYHVFPYLHLSPNLPSTAPCTLLRMCFRPRCRICYHNCVSIIRKFSVTRFRQQHISGASRYIIRVMLVCRWSFNLPVH